MASSKKIKKAVAKALEPCLVMPGGRAWPLGKRVDRMADRFVQMLFDDDRLDQFEAASAIALAAANYAVFLQDMEWMTKKEFVKGVEHLMK